ncbi:MAG: LPXTG cell wall anchor domain-containing protein [Candidatus Alectryocaccobium sp.]
MKAPSKTAQSGKTVKSVNTGDNTNVVIWGGVLLLSLLISAAALFARRKKH